MFRQGQKAGGRKAPRIVGGKTGRQQEAISAPTRGVVFQVDKKIKPPAEDPNARGMAIAGAVISMIPVLGEFWNLGTGIYEAQKTKSASSAPSATTTGTTQRTRFIRR